MLKKLAFVIAIGIATAPAFAADPFTGIEKSIALKDGSTVHVFPNGKMAMESRYGKVAWMEDGQVMETVNGEKIIMKGNETARLDAVLYSQYRN